MRDRDAQRLREIRSPQRQLRSPCSMPPMVRPMLAGLAARAFLRPPALGPKLADATAETGASAGHGCMKLPAWAPGLQRR